MVLGRSHPIGKQLSKSSYITLVCEVVKQKIVKTRNSDFFFPLCPSVWFAVLRDWMEYLGFWGIWQGVELAVHHFTISGEKEMLR